MMLLSDSGHAALLWDNCYVQISKLQIYNTTDIIKTYLIMFIAILVMTVTECFFVYGLCPVNL